jgi:tRNA (guanine-N7-)-methyltransferase
MDHAPLHPYETTWEDWLLGGGATGRFDDPTRPLQVEIGPGEDAFLYESARAEPDVNWLGIEYSRKRVRRYVRRIERGGVALGNLRLIWRPAADLVGPFLSPARVQAYHVYFPDPWPKAHHARYRMVSPSFAASLGESLLGDGCMHLATDAPEYADEIREAFAGVEGMAEEAGAAPAPLRATVFEERWRAMGREIYFLRFRRAEAPA